MFRQKYPRTFHLPFSLCISSDDKVVTDLSLLEGQEVVATLKKDGENATLYKDGYSHARSIDSASPAYRNMIKSFWASRFYLLPDSYTHVCGEDLFAKHSIYYENLKSYFYGFSLWSGSTCIDWDTTVSVLNDLDIVSATEIYRGIFCQKTLKKLASELDTETEEGFVVRLTSSFDYSDFEKCVVKWVRKDHVQTNEHWQHSQIIPNRVISCKY